jgi:hypothetical protein
MATSLIVRLRKFDSRVTVLVGILLIWEPFLASAGVSADQVRATVEKVVAILQESQRVRIGLSVVYGISKHHNDLLTWKANR